MLKSKAKWTFRENNVTETDTHLDNLQLSDSVKQLLIQRGIYTEEAATRFLDPQLTDLQSPSKLDGINRAVERIQTAINEHELIVVYGDYDADGVCSTTVLLQALNELGAQCDFYIPNRFKEGYGLNSDAIERLYSEGCDLLITVDNGIASHDEVEVANGLGMDIIITDHHEIQDTVPNAFAVIHPKCSPLYEFKELAGVGVAFKLAEQLLGYFPEHLLDLVAIGTIADLVPLVEENRVLVSHGLNVLSETNNIGLKALIETCNIETPVTEENVGFLIGPRLNAVGRLQSASLAVQLLMSEFEEEASIIANQIEEINRERQKIVAKIVNEAEQMVDPTDGVIILHHEEWHEGVLGIAASRIVNKFDRPVIMLRYDDEKNEYKGSARSIPAFDLFKSCMSLRHLFQSFGGHSQAAGMTIAKHDLEPLKEALNNLIFSQLSEQDFQQEIIICQTVDLNEVTEKFVYELSKLAPFGMSNPPPIIHIKEIPTSIRQIGQNKNHLKMQFMKEENVLDLIGFYKGNLYPYISKHVPVSTVGALTINEWNGTSTVQLVMEDIRIDEWQLFDYRGRNNWLDLAPYISQYECTLIIGSEDSSEENVIQFDSDISTIDEVDLLVVSDLPPKLADLERIVQTTQPNSILVNFELEKSVYLESMPTRDDFKWLYAYVFKHESVNMKERIQQIMKMKRWTKEDIIFMVQVFIDLDFVKADAGVVEINKSAPKSDLTASPTYQEMIEQKEIEKLLYYSNYEQLKGLFLQWINSVKTPKEDAVYGL